MNTNRKTIDKETISVLDEIIKTAEKFKNAYFWNPPYSAHGRRNMEYKNSFDTIEWVENGNTYTAEYSVRCSCRNVYAYGRYTKNGKTTNLTAIRNSYKRLLAS